MTDLLRRLQELYRLHPLPWRLNGFGFTDYRGCAVSSERCAAILAYGYDIVPLVEQCAEHGLPEDIRREVEKELVTAERALDEMTDRADEFRDERDDAIASLRDAEDKIVGLENTIDALETKVCRQHYGLDDV